MPELPEVEITRRSIAPYLKDQAVSYVLIRERRLRWPIDPVLKEALSGQVIEAVERRAKYLLLRTAGGHILLHLGMSGRLRILPHEASVQKHDHVDIVLANGYCLRFTDPRRFGALLWIMGSPEHHPLLCSLGPEPLGGDFSAAHLYNLARGRKLPVKSYIMNSRVVVGIGNIYANEALFLAGIRPQRAAGCISLARYEALVAAIREVLTQAIHQGGTTLRDFVGGMGDPGYFQHSLRVYERARLPCVTCGEPVRLCRVGQRATYYCAHCQH